MEGYQNYGLILLQQADVHMEGFKGQKTYNAKQHEEIKASIYLLKQQFMLNRLSIEVDLSAEELKAIVESQYITLKGKTWSVPHNEIVTLQINKGKGRLNITEVYLIEEDETTDLKVVKE